jgi:hypothetical protein
MKIDRVIFLASYLPNSMQSLAIVVYVMVHYFLSLGFVNMLDYHIQTIWDVHAAYIN